MNKNLVIGFISECISEKNAGIGRYSLNLLKGLKKNGYKIILIDSRKKSYLSQYSFDTIIIKKNYTFFTTFFWHLELGFKIKKYITKFDILLNPSGFPVFTSNSDIKKISVIHDLSPLIYPSKHKRGKALMFKYLYPLALTKKTKIIAVSQSTKNDIHNLYNISRSKITVIYEAAESIFNNKLKGTEKKVRNKYNLPKQFYLFVGTVEPRKNVGMLLNAFDKVYSMNQIPLVIVGKKGWRFKKIGKTLNNLIHSKNVYWLDFINDDELSAIYRIGLALIYPTMYEGFGLPLLEAMKSGCPIITSNNSSIPEIVGNSSLIVEPLNTKNLVKCMIKIASDGKMRGSLIERGLKRSEIFSWSKTIADTSKVISSFS